MAAETEVRRPVLRAAPNGRDEWRTPADLFAHWNMRCRGFTLDAAANSENALCDEYFSIERCGLLHRWHGKVWCNPPYSNVGAWVRKAHAEMTNVEPPRVIAMLLPANRTEQDWWHEYVETYRDRYSSPFSPEPRFRVRTHFVRGRVRFIAPPMIPEPSGRPMFGSVVVLWERGGA